MLNNAKLGAVIPVTDLDRARNFYENVLGLPIHFEDLARGSVIYRSGAGYFQIYLRGSATSGDHTAALLSIDSDFDAIVDTLIERGVTFDPFEIPGVELNWDARGTLTDGEDRAGWFKDPDGNIIAILQTSQM